MVKSNDGSNQVDQIRALTRQVVRLEAEVRQINSKLTGSQAPFGKKILNFLRRFLLIILVVLSALFINLSVASVWVKRNVVNTDVWVEKTSQIIQNPSVRQDISKTLASNIFEKTDAKNDIEKILPEKIKILSSPLTNNLENFTAQEINKLIASDQFIQFWQTSNRLAHSGIIKSLESANNPDKTAPTEEIIYIQNEELILNLQPVFSNIQSKLSDRGLNFVNDINIKNIDKTLPLARISNFQTILAGFNAINKAALVLPVLALLSIIGALLLSKAKRLTIIVLALITTLLMVINVQLIYLARYPFVNNITQAFVDGDSRSAQSIFSILFNDLIMFDRILILAALLTIIITFLTGPYRQAVWVRKTIANLFSGSLDNKFTKWLTHNSKTIIVITGVIALILLIFPLAQGPVYVISILLVYSLLVLILLSTSKSKPSRSKKKN